MYQGMTYLSRLGCRHVSKLTFEKNFNFRKTLTKNDKNYKPETERLTLARKRITLVQTREISAENLFSYFDSSFLILADILALVVLLS